MNARQARFYAVLFWLILTAAFGLMISQLFASVIAGVIGGPLVTAGIVWYQNRVNEAFNPGDPE